MAAPIRQLTRTPAVRRLLLSVKRLGVRVLRSLLVRAARARPADGAEPGDKVFILLVSAWGMGGTIRAAINLAGYLADHHEVEIVSSYRRREQPYFPFGEGVKVTALDDERAGATPWYLRPLRSLIRRSPSVLYPSADLRSENHSLWTDLALVRKLRRQSGIVIATRPGLNMLVALLDAPGLVKVGVEQMHLGSHSKRLRKGMLRRYPRLDGLAVLTEQDQREYQAVLDGSIPMWRIPNTVREIEPPQADMAAKRMLAAGRLTPQKGFDMLIHAFAPVAAKHPDWELRICGGGQSKSRLEARIDNLGLRDQVTLAGPSDDIPGEMAQASLYVLSSRFEGFPLVLIEAMAKGMAVVAFDCPTGPSDMIDDHRNGILVPALDIEGLSRGMLELVEDEELRRRCAAAAVDGARRFTMAAVGPQWDAMLQELVQARPRPSAA